MGAECSRSSRPGGRHHRRRRLFVHDVRGRRDVTWRGDSSIRLERCLCSGVRARSASRIGWPSAAGPILARTGVVSGSAPRASVRAAISERSARQSGSSSNWWRGICGFTPERPSRSGSGATTGKYFQRHSGWRALARWFVAARARGLAGGWSDSAGTSWQSLTRGRIGDSTV